MTRFKDTQNFPDALILTAIQSRMARAGLGLGVRDIAKLAGVSTNTIHRLESGEKIQPKTLQIIRSAYEEEGAGFIETADGKVGVAVS